MKITTGETYLICYRRDCGDHFEVETRAIGVCRKGAIKTARQFLNFASGEEVVVYRVDIGEGEVYLEWSSAQA